MKKFIIIGLVLLYAIPVYGDFISREPVEGGVGYTWVNERAAINNNFTELWSINFSDIDSATTANAFVIGEGGSLGISGSGTIFATDFGLVQDADGGEYDIYNLDTVGLDSLKADDAFLSIGDPDPANTGDDVHIMMDGAPDAEDGYSGITIIDKNAGENITQWDLVYFDTTDSEWKQADANESGEWPAWAMATAAGSDTTELIVLTKGIVRNDNWAGWTVGAVLYLDITTPGGLTETAPSVTDECIQPVARVITSKVIMVDIDPIHGYGKAE